MDTEIYPFRDHLAGRKIDASTMDIDTDNEGQLIIYTNLYEWRDGTIHTEKERI